MALINVLRNGPCEPDDTCTGGCDGDEVCVASDRRCGRRTSDRMCAPRSVGCSAIDPVCGCDGLAYETRCEAHGRRIDVGQPEDCEVDARIQACTNLCLRSEDCGLPTDDCETICPAVVSACRGEEALAMFGCSLLSDCSAIEACVGGLDCFL